MSEKKHVLAMYDIRGIQKFIFRTSKMKDAIGASHVVENIIGDALRNAIKSEENLNCELEWESENGILQYDNNTAEQKDVQVLYIGGGNAYVMYRDKELAQLISRKMARYTMDHTYSLQLATAIVEKTDNYKEDYKRLNEEMIAVKDRMSVSKPLDALPVVKIEKQTGYPVTKNGASTESLIKSSAADKVRKQMSLEEKIFDNYVNEKGKDSLLAVIHIDGNNMGRRIRALIKDKETYAEAIPEMRNISYAIDHSYKQVFEEMQKHFNPAAGNKGLRLMKILTAGDDITYVCNADIAIDTVEFFSKRISAHSMKEEKIDDPQYRFSVCAGISFFHSHFPFHIAYQVAEECCDRAKEKAKKAEYIDGERIGNWFDFQFCRNIQALDLKKIRKEEYRTMKGENLLRRPYFIPVEEIEGTGRFREMRSEMFSLERFKKDMKTYVLNKETPRSFIKDLRNTYPLGEEQVNELCAFLRSRDWKLPEELYYMDGDQRTALLYDALELADNYQIIEESQEV